MNSKKLYIGRIIQAFAALLLCLIPHSAWAVPPEPPVITSPTNGTHTNDTTPTFDGTAEANSTVEVFAFEASLGTTSANALGAWSLTPGSEMAEASYSITAKATNGGAETSDPSTAISITVDTNPPSAPTIYSPLDGASSNDTTPEISGVTEANSSVEVFADAVSLGSTNDDGTGAWTFTPSAAFSEGTYSITAKATDRASNTGDESEAVSLTIDITPPAAPLITSPSDGTLTNDMTPTISGTATANFEVSIYANAALVGSSTASAGGNWSFTPSSSLNSGMTYSFSAKTIDVAGNASSASNTVDVTIDASAPSPPTISSPANGLYTNDSTPTITGTAEANCTIEIKGNLDSLGTTSSGGTGAWSFTPSSAIGENVYSLVTYATDVAGNTSAGSPAVTITVDTTPPNQPSITSPSNGSTTNNATPTISGTAEANSSIRVFANSSSVGTTTSSAAGQWSLTVATPLANGTYSLTAKATDAAQNASQASETVVLYMNSDLDSDGDGVSDEQEDLDGTDPLDRGSNLPVLGTTVCAEWNGFLGAMYNIMEHVNLSSLPLQVVSTLYSISGTGQSSSTFGVNPGAQYDLLVHGMSGRIENSYGKVCSTHDGAKGDLDGRMVYYKTAEVSASAADFEFAFAMSFTNGHRGRQFVPFNTYQPSLNPAEKDNGVANWIQLTNVSNSKQTGKMYFYSMSGEELGNTPVTLPAGGRVDFSGHQYGRNLVGIIEWRPDNEAIDFQLRNVRYYYDSPDISVNSFVTASQFEGQVGNGTILSVPLDTKGCSAILEIANTTDSQISVYVKIYSEVGLELDTRTVTLGAYASEHIITDSILSGAQGMATIEGSAPESVIATAMHYGRDELAGIKYMYGFPAKESVGLVLRGTYNTFLEQGCWLFLTNSTYAPQSVQIGMVRGDGTPILVGHEGVLAAKGLLRFNLCNTDLPDHYGVVTVQANKKNTITGTVLRLGKDDQYRFPTDLRQ